MMVKFISCKLYFLILTSLIWSICFSQETYNFEIIFKKTHEPTTWFEGFGQALSTAGDVNSDGFDDILIGSPSGEVRGRCYLYYGGDPMDTIVDMTFYGDTAGDGFAISICSGYLNDDSFPDIAVGLPNGWVNSMQPGKVYVYFGGSGLDTIPDIVLIGQSNAELFGYSVTCGDINNDGSDDLVVGQYWGNGGNGRVYVYYGGPLLDTIPDVIINGHNGESMGITVGSGGDVNSDGYEDLVVGALNNDEVGWGAGKVYVFFGGNPMDTIPDCWLHGEGAVQLLGWNGVDVLSNVSEFDRVLTGTPYWPNGYMAPNAGKIYVLDGGESMDTLVDWWTIGEMDSSFLGAWSSSAGDCDGNLFEDIISGAPGSTALHPGGIVYLWLSGSSIDTIPDGWLTSNTLTYYLIGCRVASAGDVNNDGYDDVMFSNCAADSNQTVWVCRYTGEGIQEVRSEKLEAGMEVYPNPFSEKTTINLRIEHRPKSIEIEIFDVSGRLVKSFNHSSNPRFNHIVWYGEDNDNQKLPCGVYFVRLQILGCKEIKKVILLK